MLYKGGEAGDSLAKAHRDCLLAHALLIKEGTRRKRRASDEDQSTVLERKPDAQRKEKVS